MTRSDAQLVQSSTGWRSRFSIFFGAAVVLAICGAVRFLWGTDNAGAETSSKARTVTQRVQPPQSQKLAPSASPATNKVVAVVNGKKITRYELAEQCRRRFGKKVLETLVNKRLILEACQKRKINITAADVRAEVKKMAEKFGMSTDRWLETLLQERGITPKQYRHEIIWPTLALRQLAASDLIISEDEMERAWQSKYGPKVQIRIISVTSQQGASRIHKLVMANPDSFAELARKYSEDKPSAPYGGRLPPIRLYRGDPVLEKTAFGMKEGQISPVIHVANQYLILQCEQHIKAVSVSAEHKAAARNQLAEGITQSKLRGVASVEFETLQDQAEIVNIFNNEQLRERSPGVAATINGHQISMRYLAEHCLDRHGESVLSALINHRLLVDELARRKKQVSKADLRKEIAGAALANGFILKDGRPDTKSWQKMVMQEEGLSLDLYVEDMVWPSAALKKLTEGSVQITEEDLKKGFASNYGPRVECMAIVMNDQHRAQEVWNMANKNRSSDDFFGQLAKQYSIEPVSRGNLGRIPPIRKYGGQPHLEDEAFRLKPGEISGLIAVADKFVIFRCLGYTKPDITSFGDVKDILLEDLREKKTRVAMADHFENIHSAAQIDNFLAGTTQAGRRPRGSAQPKVKQAVGLPGDDGQRAARTATRAVVPVSAKQQ